MATTTKENASVTVRKVTRDRLMKAKRELSFDEDRMITLDGVINKALDHLVQLGIITPTLDEVPA